MKRGVIEKVEPKFPSWFITRSMEQGYGCKISWELLDWGLSYLQILQLGSIVGSWILMNIQRKRDEKFKLEAFQSSSDAELWSIHRLQALFVRQNLTWNQDLWTFVLLKASEIALHNLEITSQKTWKMIQKTSQKLEKFVFRIFHPEKSHKIRHET